MSDVYPPWSILSYVRDARTLFWGTMWQSTVLGPVWITLVCPDASDPGLTIIDFRTVPEGPIVYLGNVSTSIMLEIENAQTHNDSG